MISEIQLEQAMRHAIDLASRGPATGENPQVGCVLLDDSNTIVAEGWHRGVGTPHAEVDALGKLPTVDGHPDARGLTAVVTLEPCNHTGRTGPCSVALLEAGIAKVYYATSDPGPLAGGGAERLANGGVSVTGGVLRAEAEEFQHEWLTAARLRRPYVTIKWASTLDGRAAAADGSSQWITGAAARQRVHEQREASDAILVGTGTALADDPSLTARGDAGELMEHQPIAVVIGERPLPDGAKLRQHPGGLIEILDHDLDGALSTLFGRGIRRLYVEGGPTLESALIAAGLVDEYAIYLAPALLGGDRLAVRDIGAASMPDIRRLEIVGLEQLGNDLLITARPEREN
ncbi:MAG: diaminohydroxyphosphoribosylaminopyrimidine deaminase [Actinomycetota bacterium]|jgi:diaminohydroxyphosphoribosylaminopyrimidine deaminase/5-amino-6-(5-phosphoribosylamino)uracil reductase|nr:diaminohydroxyphosphoribosylaminopyrimidine deaminase [Actinomycetota bacterium]